MSEVLTLEISDVLAQRVRAVATASNCRVEDVVFDCLDKAISMPDVTSLADAELLKLCEAEMELPQQEERSDLLARNREEELAGQQRVRLDELMLVYRVGLVSNVWALKEAVARGLKPPLLDDSLSNLDT